MKEYYIEKYYTLNRIPKHRQELIDRSLIWLINLLDLKNSDWPIDCKKLIDRVKESKLINFDYNFDSMSDEVDGCAKYIPEEDLYVMLLNKNKLKYPYEVSLNRRLNFTIAHELGHIAVGHVLSSKEKTAEEKDYEDIEANEFAGRFLMPSRLLFSCNYYSLSSVADYFLVSKKAIWRRLNNMKRLDLFYSQRIRTCESCGNTKFSLFSEYCGICGNPLRGALKGIQRFHYPSAIETDRFKRVIECPICKFKHFNGDKCARCGTYIYNYCSQYLISGDDDCGYANNSNHRFCEMCGKPTYFYNRGLLNPWQDDIDGLDSYFDANR